MSKEAEIKALMEGRFAALDTGDRRVIADWHTKELNAAVNDVLDRIEKAMENCPHMPGESGCCVSPKIDELRQQYKKEAS